MLEHSVHELQRQYDAARSRAAEAQKALARAEERLVAERIRAAEAAMRARGIEPGARVVGTCSIRNGAEVRSDVGIDMGYVHDHGTSIKIDVRAITKAGRPHGSQRVRASIFNPTWNLAE